MYGGFVDDHHVGSNSILELQRAHQFTTLWAHTTGGILNPEKSKIARRFLRGAVGFLIANVEFEIKR